MKRYIRASHSSYKDIPGIQYYNIYETDSEFEDVIGNDDSLEAGFRIDEHPEGYDEYTIVAHAVAEPKYEDILRDDGYEVLEVYEDENGKKFLGYYAHRLYDVGEEIEELMEEYEEYEDED